MRRHSALCRDLTRRVAGGMVVETDRALRQVQGSMMRADFVSQAYFRNPSAEIEKLRSAGPVIEVQFPMIGKV
jgi:hypothetical protein